MKKRYPLVGLSLLTFCLFVLVLCIQSPSSFKFPLPTEFGENEEEEEANREKRKAWIENMHRAAPGTDWRQHDRLIRQNRANKIMDMRLDLLRKGRFSRIAAEESFANGRLTGTWQELGSDNQAGRVHIADVDQSTNTIYCASAGGNIWKGKLDGSGWTSLNDFMQMTNITSVKLLQNGAGKRLIAVDKNKVYFSDNDGVSWTTSAGLSSVYTYGNIARAVYANDATQSIFLLVTEWDPSASWFSTISVYVSTDKGQTFVNKKSFNEETYRDISHFDIWTSSNGSGKVFLINKSTLYTIDTQGNTTLHSTFTSNTTEERPLLSGFDDKRSLYLYVNMDKKIYKSNNGGSSWTLQGSVEEYPFSRNSFYCSSRNPQLVYLGGVNAFKSYNGGANWSKINHWYEYYDSYETKLHGDVPGIQSFVNASGKEFYLISTDGGLYISNDSLETVKNISLKGLNIGQYYSSYTYRTNPQIMYLGSQDQGYQKTSVVNGKLNFKQEISGDYGHIVSSDGGKSAWTVYPTFVMYDKNASASFEYSTWHLQGAGYLWLPPLMAHPTQSNKVYLAGGSMSGGSRIIELTEENGSISHTEHSFNFDTNMAGKISAMAFSPINPSFRYVLTERGIFYRSTDVGQTWTKTAGFNGPQGHYFYGSSIVASSQNLGTVYIAGSGYSNSPAYVSTDHGHTFKEIKAGLPSTMIYQMAATPDEKMIFAATEVGPYVYIKADDKWYDMSGLSAPDQTYWSVDYIPAANIVRFATFGRGVWDFKVTAACDITGDITFTGTTTFCQGDSLVLQAPAGNNFVYQWQKNGTDLANTNKRTFSAKETGNYAVKVTSSTCVKSLSGVAVTVKPIPTAPPTITGVQETCTGTQAYSIAGTQAVSYTWKLSGGGTLSGSGTSVNVNWTTPGTHTITVTPVSNDCPGKPRTLAVTVQALPGQPITISGLQETCKGEQEYSVPQAAGVNYTWQLSGGGTLTGSGNKVTINWTTPGHYTVTVTPATQTCTGTPLTSSVVVKDIPLTPVITQNNGVLSSSTSTGNQWFQDNVRIEGATGQTFTPTSAGVYTVQASNACGQSERSAGYEVQATGLADDLEKLIKLYPNPADDFITVELPEGLQALSVGLYDVSGKQVRSLPGNKEIKLTVDVRELSKGTYALRIETTKGTVIRKVIIQ